MAEFVGDGLVHFATITSRVEALVIATALEDQGIPVWIDGIYHASVDPLSVALGGHRMTLPAAAWTHASELVREIGLPESEVVYEAQQLAVLRFLGIFLGMQLFFAVPAFIMGWIPAMWFAVLPLSAAGVPVDPRGPNDFYLAAED